MTTWVLPLLVFSTVFERLNIYWSALGFSLKISLILLPIAALVLLIKKRLTFNPTFLFPFLAVLILVEILSIFTSFDPFQSFQVVVFRFLMFGLFYLIVWSIKKSAGLTRLIWAWGAGAATVSVLGIWQFFRYTWGADPTLFFERWFSARTLPVDTFIQSLYSFTSYRTRWELGLMDHFLRPPSTFIDVSTGASFVGIFLILGLSWFLSFKKEDLRRVMLTALMVPSAVYFLMAVSRSAALGLVFGLGVFAYLTLKDRLNRKMLKGLLITAVAAILTLGIAFTVVSRERLGSVLTRLTYAQDAWQMFLRNPLTGVGAGNFESYCVSILHPGSPACYSHSIFVTWLGELGVLGVGANLSVIAVIALFSWRVLTKLKYDSATYLRLAGLLSALVALVFANVFHAHYGLDFTWVLVGLLVSGYYLAKHEIGDRALEKLDVLGVKIDNVTMEQAVERIKGFFKSGKKAYVVTPNSEFIVKAQKDHEFRKILNDADLVVPDGSGPVWASRIWGTPLKSWVAGTDLFFELCAEAARRGGQIFLLGAKPGIAERAAQNLKAQYPKLKIAGTFAGDGSPAGDTETVAAVKRAVKPTRPIDFLFVAYGQGKQERWIKRNLNKIPLKVAMGIGGAIDFAAGQQKRAPKLFRRLGLEWMYRLIREPKRIKRQLALVPFSFLAFKESFKR